MKKAKLLVTMLLALVMSLALVVFASCGGTPIDTGSESTSGTSESVDGGSDEGSGETSGEDSGSTIVDETAPEITLSTEETQFNVNLGESFTLPSITVTDNVDDAEDIFVDISCDTIGAATIKDGVFTSNILGTYTITYAAVDSSDNEAFESITINVVSEEYVETYDVTGYDNIDALKNDGGIYKENFAKGMNSPLIKGAMQVGYIQAGANALTGNSIVMDYASMEGTSNQFFLSNVSPYLRSGKWTVTFDVKLVSGTGFSDFYFGYVKEGNVDSTDQQFNISDMTVGEVRTLTYSQLITFDADTTYWFHFFKYQQNGDAVLALDNFTFKYEEKIYTEVTPTLEQLKAGFTYDWTNAYMAMSASEPMKVSEIADENIKSAISASEGFSDTVMHLTGGGQHNISILDRSKNPEFFQTGLVYEFEFTYYSVKNGGNHMIVLDGTSSNYAFWTDPFKQGLNTAKNEYTIRAIDNAFTFFGEMDVYLGNLKITVSDPVVERTDYVVPTDAQMLAEGGYTWDWTENNIAQFASYKYEEISKMKDATLAAALTETGAFTSGYALRFNAHNNLDAMNGKLVAGNKYIVSFTAYAVSGKSNIAILPMNASFGQAGELRFTTTDNTNGTVTYTVEFTAAESYVHMYFYALGEIEIYLANLTIVEMLPPSGLVEKTKEGTVSIDKEFTLGENSSETVYELGGIVEVENFKSIKLVINYTVNEGFNGRLVYWDGAGQFDDITATAGAQTATLTYNFGVKAIKLHVPAGSLGGKVYVKDLSYIVTYRGEEGEEGEEEVTPEQPELVKKTVSGTKVWSDCGAGKKHVATPATPEAVAGKKGFTDTCLQFNGNADIMELVANLSVENMVSIELTFYYYVANIASGRQLYVMLDFNEGARDFKGLDATPGYHATTVSFTAQKVNYVCLHINGTTQADSEFYLGGFDYVITYMEEAEEEVKKTTVSATELNAFNKGEIVDTPAAAASKEGFGEKALKISGGEANTTYELTQMFNALTKVENFEKITFTVYYYVESVEGTGTFRLRCDANFPSLDSTVGYHAVEITPVDGNGNPVSVDFLCIYFDTAVYGTLYIGSIEYTITYKA